MHEAGYPKPSSGTTQRERVGREMERGSGLGGGAHVYTYGQFMLMYGKTVTIL